MNTEEEKVQIIVQRLEAMPQPEVENFLKASKEELAREVVNLRLFVAQLFLEVKEYRKEHDIYVNAGMDHHADMEEQEEEFDIPTIAETTQEETEL